MSKTRVIIFTVFIVLGLYDVGAEYIIPEKLPTISELFGKYVFQFSFWEFVAGLTCGHLFFNRIPKART